MSKRKRKHQPPTPKKWTQRIPKWAYPVGLASILAGVLLLFTNYESYASLYDADYTGSEACGDCHSIIYERWLESPHANMTREPDEISVVGNYDDGSWFIPPEAQVDAFDASLPAARMYHEGDRYFMALRRPGTDQFVPFEIAYVIGYQYRQTYVTREDGGILRRLPLQWSVEMGDYFPYWNVQEGSLPTLEDLWVQMTTLNSAWNLFCARCHTTDLDIQSKNESHTQAVTEWVDNGIGCESCHGPGSQHENYFEGNYINRVVAFVNSNLRDQPVAYIANAPRLEKGEDLSVCARCHGPDIKLSTTDIYRVYEPGYSQEGRINDLSPHFTEMPLEPGRDNFTVEVWDDGDPKGIAMVFRSFVESVCYQQAEPRCYDCHDPHNNKSPTEPGLLEASLESNSYCLACHTELEGEEEAHSNHTAGESGSFCYDCHLPPEIKSIVTGIERDVRTHTMSSLPDPENTVIFGENAPNACNACHTDQSAEWSVEWMEEWYRQ